MKSFVLMIILLAITIFCYGFPGKRDTATEGSVTSTNFSGANMTGANLTGVNLDRVIFCNSIMPDGTINNSGC
jgi:uncharacterized protein YjbI with pentapeptide repeats